jgi:uncharacterized protein (DUF885 family)
MFSRARTLGVLPLLSLVVMAGAACGGESYGGGEAGAGRTSVDSAASKAVIAIADEYVRDYFAQYPEQATLEGVATADNGRLAANSLAAITSWQGKEDGWNTRLRAIDATHLDESTALVAGFLRQQLEAAIGARVCRAELWTVSPTFNSWQANLSIVAGVQPVGNDAARTDAVSRFSQIPRFLDEEMANLREGIRLGYTASAGNVEKTLEQMDALVASAPEATPFYDPAMRDSTPAFRADMRRVVMTQALPAVKTYRDFLRNEYLPKARKEIGVSANPDGPSCYAATIRYFTSLSIPAEEIHAMGLAEMAKIDSQVKVIAQRLLGTSDVAEAFKRVKTDPKYTFKSRAEIVQLAERAINRAKDKVPEYFGRVPKATVIVQQVPAFQEKQAPGGQYQSPSDDGKRPGTYLINTYDAEHTSRASLESTAFHETYPGHHLQIALAKERPGAHPITRYFTNSGFVEGWGLYSERLADEMGLFSSDIDRLGLLSNEALRAGRLVVDAGMHTMGWSRQRAIDYLLAHTAESESGATSEIDRYIAVPGQATAYMVGNLEIRRLRAMAQQTLGPKFDIKDFHDRVLEHGSVTLSMLREQIQHWVDSKK